MAPPCNLQTQLKLLRGLCERQLEMGDSISQKVESLVNALEAESSQQEQEAVSLLDKSKTEHSQIACGYELEIAYLESELERERKERVSRESALETQINHLKDRVTRWQLKAADRKNIAQQYWQRSVEANARTIEVEAEIEKEFDEQFKNAIAVWDNILAKFAVKIGVYSGLIYADVESALDVLDGERIPGLRDVLRESAVFQQLWIEAQEREHQLYRASQVAELETQQEIRSEDGNEVVNDFSDDGDDYVRLDTAMD